MATIFPEPNDPAWIKGRPGGWENELLDAYLLPTGPVAAYSMPLIGGSFLWADKVYCRAAVKDAARSQVVTKLTDRVGLPELVCGAPARAQNLLAFAQFRRSPTFEPTC